jgi:NifU-like protein involved in Fe-S cluster formation
MDENLFASRCKQLMYDGQTDDQSPRDTIMANDTDLIKLYSGRILALAADIPHLARLDAPHGTIKKRSPLCGSTVTVDVEVNDGRVTAFGQDVKACALGQAAAAITGSAIIGRTFDEVETARDALRTMLKDAGPVPAAPFDGFEVLEPAREYKNRHASILLAIEATVEAMEQAAQSDCA